MSFENLGLRAELLAPESKISYRVREAELRKIPYMLVVGRREAESKSVSLRTYQEKDRGVMPLDAVVAELRSLVENRKLDVQPRDYSRLFRTESPAPEASY